MEINLKGHYAGFAGRFLAYALDLAVVVVGLALITWVVKTTQDIFGIGLVTQNAFWITVAAVFSFLSMGAYYVFFWSLVGQTPGKMVLGVRVVSVDGRPVSLWQAVRRFIGYFISFILFLGYLWILIDDRRQGWHDKIAETFVVYAWDARPGELFQDRVAGEPEA